MNSFDPMTLVFHGEDDELWKEGERMAIETRDKEHPLQRNSYIHPNDPNLIIFPEPRHYGIQAGQLDQLTMQWFDKEPETRAEQN